MYTTQGQVHTYAEKVLETKTFFCFCSTKLKCFDFARPSKIGKNEKPSHSQTAANFSLSLLTQLSTDPHLARRHTPVTLTASTTCRENFVSQHLSATQLVKNTSFAHRSTNTVNNKLTSTPSDFLGQPLSGENPPIFKPRSSSDRLPGI